MQATGLNFSHEAIYSLQKAQEVGAFGYAHHIDEELRLSKGVGAQVGMGAQDPW